jgi:hypothetical protein
MNRFTVTASAIVTLGLFACTSPVDKGSTSPGAAVDAIQNPTGSFGADNAGAAFGRYSENKNASSGLSSQAGGGSGASGSSTTQSLHVLANKAQTSTSSCSEGSACACEGGGSFTYHQQQSDYGPAITATFDACVMADGSGFAGDMLLLVSDKPILKEDKAGVGSDAAAGKSLLLAAEGTFTATGGKSLKAEVVFLDERGVDYLAVEVADGKIVIGVRKSDGLAVVYAKDTMWVCKPDASQAYACVEQSSGQKVSTDPLLARRSG